MRTPRPTHSRTALAVMALALGAGLLHPVTLSAGDLVLLNPPPIIRKFPENVFCPVPISLQFTASGPVATIHAVANVYTQSGSTFFYTRQAIDNMVIVPLATYNAHLVPNDGDYDFCYLDDQVPQIFLFDQVAPASAQLYEKFTALATGWDLTQAAYFDGSRSAHNDPSNTTTTHDASGGCLGLGLETSSPALTDSARTSVDVTDLTPGQEYVLSGWWIVGEGIFTEDATLTIKITGSPSTPISTHTWGAIKARYRK